jgi:hypothetical protein
VALAAGALLLTGGALIAWLWRGPPTVTAHAQSAPSGEDILRLQCDPDRCREGTTVEVSGAHATFSGGVSELTLPEPLRIGPNALTLHMVRPGHTREETLKLIVPVAFRIRADPSTMSSSPPTLTMRVEAAPGSEVTMDGKPLALDATGHGSYAVDESAATEGAADESRAVSAEVPYVVTSPSADRSQPALVEKGTVTARVVVAPLHVDAPSQHAVVDGDHVLIAGRAAKGATATVDGAPVAVGAEGIFSANVSLPVLGERAIEVRTETPALRPRTVHLRVKRVASLADEARAFEQREKVIGYDAAARDLSASVDRAIVVEGEIIDSRRFGYGSVLLVDDRRGCAKGPCLARVLLTQDTSTTRGMMVRAYGRIARPFAAPSGQTVPEVEADFIVTSRR